MHGQLSGGEQALGSKPSCDLAVRCLSVTICKMVTEQGLPTGCDGIK